MHSSIQKSCSGVEPLCSPVFNQKYGKWTALCVAGLTSLKLFDFLWTFWAVPVLGGKLKKPSAMETNSVMNGEAMPCFTSSGGSRASHHVFVLEPSGWIFTSRLSTYMSTKSSPVPWPTGSTALKRGKTQITGSVAIRNHGALFNFFYGSLPRLR